MVKKVTGFLVRKNKNCLLPIDHHYLVLIGRILSLQIVISIFPEFW
jgi:hypothetical protein